MSALCLDNDKERSRDHPSSRLKSRSATTTNSHNKFRPNFNIFNSNFLLQFFLVILLHQNITQCSAQQQQQQQRGSRWWWQNIQRLTNMGRLLMGEDPLLLSGKHEGDVVISPGQENVYGKNAEEKNAVAYPSLLWPGGVIPYEFSFGYRILPFERFLITRAMRDIERRSCVKFVERTDEYDYVKIVFDSYKCYSNVGRKGGEQIMSLGVFCVMFYDRGNVYHELLHVLGFHHEHNRPDRDEHVDVMWGNIRRDAKNNFEKRGYNTVDMLGLPYDLDSVMHYSPHAFSKIYYVLPTLISHDRGIFFTRSRWPSKLDYAKLNRLYECESKGIVNSVINRLTDFGRRFSNLIR